jgi:hypothetical protein
MASTDRLVFGLVVPMAGNLRAIEIVHFLARITVWSLDNQVIMICHEDIYVKQEIKFRLCFGNIFLKFQVVIFEVNILLRCYPALLHGILNLRILSAVVLP